MAKLYVFAVCDKVIQEQSGPASLISLFSEVHAVLPPEVESVPSNAVVPREWFIFTSWEQQPEDKGKEYREVIELIYPDGTVFAKPIEIKFVFQPDKSHHQTAANVLGFPIGQRGVFTVKMRLETGGSIVFGPESIHINVVHDRPAQARP
jgi:hypothetical protein